MLEKVEEVVLGLTRLLDSRVFVALGRGLWDFTAKDVYDYVESLQEDRHNKAKPCCPLRPGRCPEPAFPVITRLVLSRLIATLSNPCSTIDCDETDSYARTDSSALRALGLLSLLVPALAKIAASSRRAAHCFEQDASCH